MGFMYFLSLFDKQSWAKKTQHGKLICAVVCAKFESKPVLKKILIKAPGMFLIKVKLFVKYYKLKDINVKTHP